MRELVRVSFYIFTLWLPHFCCIEIQWIWKIWKGTEKTFLECERVHMFNNTRRISETLFYLRSKYHNKIILMNARTKLFFLIYTNRSGNYRYSLIHSQTRQPLSLSMTMLNGRTENKMADAEHECRSLSHQQFDYFFVQKICKDQ